MEAGEGPDEIGDRAVQVADALLAFAEAVPDHGRLTRTIVERIAVLLGRPCALRLESSLTLAPEGTLDATEVETYLRRPELEKTSRAGVFAVETTGGEPLGTLLLVRRPGDPDPVAPAAVALVELLARHAGLALANARTLQQGEYQRCIVETLSQPILVLDDEGTVRTANRAFRTMFRVTEGALVGRPWHTVANRALDVPRMRTLVEVARGAAASDVEARVTVPGLGPRVVKISLRRMRSDETTGGGAGRASGFEGVLLALEDVTEQCEIGRELERRAILFESMSEAVYAGDFEFRIKEANPAAEKLFGWTASEVRNRDVNDAILLAGVDRTAGRHRLLQGETVRGRGKVRHRQGHVMDVEFSSTPVKDAGVISGFVTVMQNITERLRMEQAAEAQLAAMKNAISELETFSYSVSHDLRAPIRAIEGFSQLLEDEHAAQLDGEGKRLLAIVRKNARRMGHLIDDLLDFSRLGRRPLATTDVDMDALCREAAEAAMSAEPGRSFELTIAPLASVDGDRSLLAQVWKNLLENAVKYTRGRSPAVISVIREDAGPEVVFHVRDNGVGFDMKYVKKLFGVFERLHTGAEFEGTGVGLALVDRIVRRHGGRVWAESVEGEGASFHFSLLRESPAREEDRDE